MLTTSVQERFKVGPAWLERPLKKVLLLFMWEKNPQQDFFLNEGSSGRGREKELKI